MHALSTSVPATLLIWPAFSWSQEPNRQKKVTKTLLVFCWFSFLNWLTKRTGKWHWTKDVASLHLLMAAYHQIRSAITSNHPQESSLWSLKQNKIKTKKDMVTSPTSCCSAAISQSSLSKDCTTSLQYLLPSCWWFSKNVSDVKATFL